MINGVAACGAYVTLPSPGPYKIRVEIMRSEADKVVEAEFGYPFSRLSGRLPMNRSNWVLLGFSP